MIVRVWIKPLLFIVLLVLVGCSGTPTTTTLARDETTSILLVGHLVGGVVEFGNGFKKTIKEDDLLDPPVSIITVKDSVYQQLEKALFRVEPGELIVNFVASDGTKKNRRIFAVPGITNEVRLD